MIAADTSIVIAYIKGDAGGDRLQRHLKAKMLVLPPLVVTETLSAPNLDSEAAAFIAGMPMLALTEGFWWRAGQMRARLLAKGFKASLADTLIAQSCIDVEVPLVTLDRDFRHFVKHGGLVLAS